MRGSFTLGKIAGIEVSIHYTWIFAFILFTWLFAGNTLPTLFPDWTIYAYWVAGAVISIMIFISVLVHEICHSLVAISRGLRVKSIVLFIFGGVSNIETEPKSAWEEFIMAGAGPASSFVIAAIFALIAYALYLPGNVFVDFFSNSSLVPPIIVVIFYIGYVNLLLAIFNIIPGFPLDGGRVFRAIIWGITKNLNRATVIAGNVGRFFGWAMILYGISNLFGISIGGVQGSFLNGIWLIFIGWFLISAADSAIREQSLQQQLAGVRVKDVMERSPECVSPNASVEYVVHNAFIQRGRRALPICNESGLLGIVTLADVKRLPQDRWANTPVLEIMTSKPLETVDQGDDMNGALRTLAGKDLNQIPVMGEGKLVGLLSRSDVIRYLQTRQELGIKPSQEARKP